MSAYTTQSINANKTPPQRNRMRCFPLPKQTQNQPRMSSWLLDWQAEFYHEGALTLADQQANALARLIPLLLCGEQSAVFTFHNLSTRVEQPKLNQSIADLKQIEADERVHERALQLCVNALPIPKDLHRIKRLSQRFYASIDCPDSIDIHFSRIAYLDSAVCILLDVMVGSSIGKHHPYALLFNRIKLDEARHVSVSRRRAQNLGLSRKDIDEHGRKVVRKLVALLKTETESFTALEIDANALFERLGNL